MRRKQIEQCDLFSQEVTASKSNSGKRFSMPPASRPAAASACNEESQATVRMANNKNVLALSNDGDSSKILCQEGTDRGGKDVEGLPGKPSRRLPLVSVTLAAYRACILT
jgi:hypothetical protein